MARPEFEVPEFVSESDSDQIQERMMGNLPADISDMEGDFPYDFTMPTAIEISQLVQFNLVRCLMVAFPEYSWGDWMDLHGGEAGVTRKEAVAATGTVSVILMLIECTESFEQRVTYHSDFSWWKYSLDGSFALDGSINLNHWYPTEFRPVYPFDTVLTENFIADRIFHRIPDVYHENIFKPSFFVRSDFVWWEGFLDGNFSLDGTRKLNSWYPMETFIGHRLFIGNQEAFETKQCISLPDMINAEKADFRGTQRVIMGWRDGNKILDGNCLLDGTLLLGAGEPPYLQTVRIRAPVKHEEEVEVTMVIPSRAARLDGTCRLDGSVKLNSGREVL